MSEDAMAVANEQQIESPNARLFDYDNIEWYRQLLLRIRYNLDLRSYHAFANTIARSLNELQRFKLNPAPGEDFQQLNRWGEQMHSDGYVDLGQLLDRTQIDEIFNFLDGKKVTYDWDKNMAPFDPNTPPEGVSIGSYNREVTMSTPHVHMIANHPRVVGVAARYLGVMPSLMALSMWWSFPGRAQGEHAELFHIDRHCYRFCKLFVYMTDVDAESGPHVYVRATGDYGGNYRHAAEKARGDQELLHKYNEILAKQRKSDEEIEELFGKDRIIEKTAKAGSAILGNTGSIHKGQVPKTNRRLLASFLYTMLPTIKDKVDRKPVPNIVSKVHQTYPGAYTDDQILYLNRLVAR